MKTMKHFLFLIITAVAFGGCMKDLGKDEVTPNENQANKKPALKVYGSNSSSADTTFAEPNVYLKFWLDELPQPVTSYTFSWNLGGGDNSTSESPEKKYQNGTYYISVVITPNGGGSQINRSIILVVRPGSGNRTILLYSATLLSGGSYDYAIAMKTTAIYNYANISGSPWTKGDWTNWEFRFITETTVINGVLYIIDHVILPANNLEKRRFVYGRGDSYGYDPNSPFWVVTGVGEGVFEVYLTNGQMSPNPVNYNSIPGKSGDVLNGNTAPTIRNEIRYSVTPNNDSIQILVNYASYANGNYPFISRMLADNNWNNIPLVKLTGQFTGWGYVMFRISDLNNGLYFRFGPDINQPQVFGTMQNSIYYLGEGNMLGLQISNARSGQYDINPIRQ